MNLHAAFAVGDRLAIAVNGLVVHGAKVDEEGELLVGEELVHPHVVGLGVAALFEEAARFVPHVLGLEPVGVDTVWSAVNADLNGGDVGEVVGFRVASPGVVGFFEEDKNAAQGLEHVVHLEGQGGGGLFVKLALFSKVDEVEGELAADVPSCNLL